MKIKNGKLLDALDSPKFNLVNQIILLGYRGSIADGTYIPNRDGGIDDKDVIGMCVPPKEYYFGLNKFEQHERFQEEWDVIVYSIAKYFRLLLKNNPNVMNLLWLPEKHYLFKNSYGQRIIDNRDVFVSKFAYKSFGGYAHGQLHRMTHGAHQGYMGEKRKKLVEKWGFDLKNACTLIRLLKMGMEFLITGELQVDRPEKHQLIEIKKGLWTLEQVKKRADELFVGLEQAFIKSKLPNKPNYDKANKLLIEITEGCLKERQNE